MRKRLLILVSGVLVVVVAMAGLTGILDLLSSTKPGTPSNASTGSNAAGLNNKNASTPVAGITPGIKLPSVSNLPVPGGTLAPGNVPGQSPSNLLPSKGISPDIGAGLSMDISPQGGLPPHIPLFDVTGASNVDLLRSVASSFYENNKWQIDPGAKSYAYLGERLTPQVINFSHLTTSQVKVTPLEDFPSGTLPVPTSLYPVSVSSSTPLTYYPNEQAFVSTQGIPEAYSFQSINYTFDPAILSKAAVDPQAKYLQLPADTTDRIKQLSREITAGTSSPYQKAKAIENYLKTNYTYDFDYKPAPSGQNPDDWFLFDEKKGVCSNFNSAFVELARSAGIPSRLVSGYAISPTADKQVVYADQAHAWAEAKFKDLGWITFDATGESPKPMSTRTEITSVSPMILKGHSFSVRGTVDTLNGKPVDGVPIEIFVNSKKDITGGTKIGKGTVNNGSFDIACVIPDQITVGNYQLLAHSLGGIRYEESWSDPQIKVATETRLSLGLPSRVKISEPVHVQGKLIEESSQAVSGQKINIAIGEQPVLHFTTDKDGQFNMDQIFTQPGDVTIKADYNNTDFYLASSQVVHTTVLIPTILKLQVPQRADLQAQGTIQGSLLESKSGKPVPSQPIQLILNGKPANIQVITDKNGLFNSEDVFDKAGIYQIEAKFASVPFYWESSDEAVVEIFSVSKLPIWFWPAVALVVTALGLGGFFWFRWQKQRSSALGQVPDIPGVAADVTSEEDNHIYGINLSIEFPKIEASTPDVWGIGDDLDVICRLINSDGVPLAAKSLDFLIGKNKSAITTDASGIGTLRCTFSKKGLFKLTARYNGEPGIEKVSVNRIIRIVDYREEIVDLFNSLVDWLRSLGITLAPEATPREIKQAVLSLQNTIPDKALCQAISCFEEADYSLHSVNRGNYLSMYLAQKEIREYEQTPTADS